MSWLTCFETWLHGCEFDKFLRFLVNSISAGVEMRKDLKLFRCIIRWISKCSARQFPFKMMRALKAIKLIKFSINFDRKNLESFSFQQNFLSNNYSCLKSFLLITKIIFNPFQVAGDPRIDSGNSRFTAVWRTERDDPDSNPVRHIVLDVVHHQWAA